MKKNIKIYENPILYLILFMICIGTVMMYSASGNLGINNHNNYAFYLKRHLIRFAISILVFLIVYNINFKFIKSYSFEILFLSWIIMLSAYLFYETGSTRRWLILFGKNIFTTSDFARLALIIFTANFIDEYRKKINDLRIIFTKYVPYFLITSLLILRQPDLSTTFSITIIVATILMIAGLKIKYILIPGIISMSSYFTYIYISNNYQYKRILEWYFGKGDNTMQTDSSIQALGNGGIFGVGFGKSIIKNGFMPEVHTDFILPIIGEEIGYLGICLIFFLFIGLYFYGIQISKTAPDIFSSMLALGISINILYYFLINASYVVGILPPTGLPIPFISYGGSQLLFSIASIAILLNISNYTNIYKYKSL